MAVAVYATPETLFGAELVTSCYREEPEDSWQRILLHMQALYPDADESEIKRICG